MDETDIEDPSRVGDAPEPPAGRGRRSDRRFSSRRRQRRRRRQAEREQRRRGGRTVEAAADDEFEIDLAEATVPTTRPVVLPLDASGDEASAPGEGAERRQRGRHAERTERRRGRVRVAVRVLGLLVLLAVAAGIGGGLRLLTDRDPEVAVDEDGQVVLPEGVDPQPTLLLVTAPETSGTFPADSAIILAYDRREERGTVLLVPVSTVVDVPGHGVLPLARSHEFGGPALTAATTDNLLGVALDGVAVMGYSAWATLFGRAGQLEVEVPERVVTRDDEGQNTVQFLAGLQSFDGSTAAEYLRARIAGQPELSALPRVQALLVAWFEALAEDDELRREVLADGLPMVDTGMDRRELVALVEELVLAAGEDRVDFRVLPVRPIGSGADDGYRPDPGRIDELVEDRFAASAPTGDRAGRSLQILNGNGLPGIGQDVAARLLPAGFRVILTGNADDFDHQVTKIVVYDDSAEQLAIAREIRELLGVGEVEISRTPQSVVDITIVVGADFTAS